MKRRGIITIGVLIVFVVLVLGIFILSKNIVYNTGNDNTGKDTDNLGKDNKGEMPEAFTSSMIKRAENAFYSGISFEDPENDWFIPEEGTMQWDKPDNPRPYPFGWTDFKRVSLGADRDYLYVKFVFYDKFPEKMPSYDGDDIFSTGAKIASMSYVRDDGKSDYAEMGIGVGWVRFTGNEKTEGYYAMDRADLGQLAMLSPNGTDEHGETIYTRMNGAGYVSGGAGYDYLLSAFPLAEFNLSLGDEVNLTLSTETGSNKWHHESIDNILDANGSKSGATIVWKLGNDSYVALPPEF